MTRRALRSVATATLVFGLTAVRAVRADDGPQAGATPSSTTVMMEPTTIPDDSYTIYPNWSNDGFDYLEPGTPSPSIPNTGRDMALLALLSAAAIVTGAGLSFGARSRVRRR